VSIEQDDGARPTISKKLRFEVFKRDSFTCQYCGRRAPEVVLHCDHIEPVANNGPTDILNLVTACIDCNLGKGARTLSDNAVLSKQLNQLAVLQEKREQMDMMLAWRRELDQLDEVPPLELEKRWDELTGYMFTETGKQKIKKLLSRFGFDDVAAAMKIAVDQYTERGQDGVITKESIQTAFDKVGGIAAVQRAEQAEPGTKRMFYIRGILRNRVSYCPDWKAMALIKGAAQAGMPLDAIEQAAREATSWSRFKNELDDYVNHIREQEEQHERWRQWMLTELTKLFGPRHAGAALSKISSAMSLGIAQKYLLDVASGYGMGRPPDWVKYERWLDQISEQWSRLICPIQDILMVNFPEEKAGDVFCMVEDFNYPFENVLTAARQLGIWERFEPWLDETFSAAGDEHFKAIGVFADDIGREAQADGRPVASGS
jgi:hypothetical protein